MSLAVPSRQSVVCCSVIGALAIVSPIAAHADDPPQGWSGQGQAGYLLSRGNSDSDSANAMLDMFLVKQDWKHELTVDGLYGKSAGVTSAERWDLRLQSNYSITHALFAFGALGYIDDRFSGFQYQTNATGGIGYKFIDSSSTKLAAQVGVGYQILRPEIIIKDADGQVTDRFPQQTQSDVVGTLGVNFEQDFNASTKLTNKLTVLSGSSNTSINNLLQLQVTMSKKLSLAAGYGIIDNTSPAAGVKHIDSTTTLNLVYKFPETAPPKS